MQTAFVIIEHDGKAADDSFMELATLARSLVGEQGTVTGLLAGTETSGIAVEVAGWFDQLRVWTDVQLSVADGERLGALFMQCIERKSPDIVVAAHTNNAMDFVPGLAVRLGRPLVTDCISASSEGGKLSAVRPVYGGKVHARVSVAASRNGCIITVRPGAVRPGSFPGLKGDLIEEAVPSSLELRRRDVQTVADAATDIDISQAERLVAVGRGIEDEEGLEMIRSLADALGAEVACSRPVVDKQWMPKSRQVGTSGKSVRPKLYVAIGISGSFQHMGGIKGDPFLVAINKDPRAPIFSVADVGIVGDLFDIVPVLEERIRAIRG